MNSDSQQIADKPHAPATMQDLVPATPLEAAQIREMAVNGVEMLQQTMKQMIENSAAMARWILASLLALNSGGAVAILSAADVVQGPIVDPLVAFAIGSSLAVATGVNGLITSLRSGPILGEAIELLRLSIFESTIHATTRQRILELQPIMRQQFMVSSALAIGSLVAFWAGIWCAVT